MEVEGCWFSSSFFTSSFTSAVESGRMGSETSGDFSFLTSASAWDETPPAAGAAEEEEGAGEPSWNRRRLPPPDLEESARSRERDRLRERRSRYLEVQEVYTIVYIYIYIISIAWKWGSLADLDASLNQRIPVSRATPSPPGRRRALGSRGSIAASGSSLIEHVSAFRGRSGTSRDGPISHFAQGVLESGKETETIAIEVNDSRKRFLTYREVSPPLRLLISSFFSSSKA